MFLKCYHATLGFRVSIFIRQENSNVISNSSLHLTKNQCIDKPCKTSLKCFQLSHCIKVRMLCQNPVLRKMH